MFKQTLLASVLFASVMAHGESIPSVVPLAKTMNPAFASDYANARVKVIASFIAATPSEGYLWNSIPPDVMQGRAGFRISPPGEVAPAFPNVPIHAFIDKSKADILFSLQQGEQIAVVGHPYIGEKLGLKQVIFVAESVERVPPSKK